MSLFTAKKVKKTTKLENEEEVMTDDNGLNTAVGSTPSENEATKQNKYTCTICQDKFPTIQELMQVCSLLHFWPI